MRYLLDTLYKSSCWLAATCIGAICLLVVSQVFLNILDRLSSLVWGSAIGLTIPSYSDFTGFLLAAASFLSLAHALREGSHIRVVLVLGQLPEKARKIAEIWCVAFALAVAGYFTFYTAKLTHESFTYNDLSSGMIAVPIWIPQSFMLVGLIILTIALCDELVTVLSGREPSYGEKGEKLLAEGSESSPGVNIEGEL